MQEILSDLNLISLSKAIKENLYAFFRYFQHSNAASTFSKGSEFYWHTPITNVWFNGVLSQDRPGDNFNEIVNNAITYFQSREVTSFSWWIAANLDPNVWSEYLLPLGFEYNNDTPGMARELARLPSQNLSKDNIELINNRSTLSEWVKTFVTGYGLPENTTPHFFNLFANLGISLPFQHYLYKIDGKSVATSTLFLGAGVAGIYNVATLPEARGQGIGSFMTLVPLHEARKMGYKAGTLQSSKKGFSVYQKLGFRKLCQIDYFSWYKETKGSEN